MSVDFGDAYLRTERSRELLGEVVADCNDYFASDPIEVGVDERGKDPLMVNLNIRVKRPVPDRTWLRASEVAHHARAALDNAVYAIAIAHGSPGEDTQRAFPIEVAAGAYRGVGKQKGTRTRRLVGVPEPYRRVVDDAQPFQNGRAAARHPLAVIASFNNRDKHRQGHKAFPVVFGLGINVRVGGLPVVSYAPYDGDFRLFDGPAGGVSMPLALGGLRAAVSGVRVGVAFAPGGWQIPDLQRAVDYADSVIQRFATVTHTAPAPSWPGA